MAMLGGGGSPAKIFAAAANYEPTAAAAQAAKAAAANVASADALNRSYKIGERGSGVTTSPTAADKGGHEQTFDLGSKLLKKVKSNVELGHGGASYGLRPAQNNWVADEDDDDAPPLSFLDTPEAAAADARFRKAAWGGDEGGGGDGGAAASAARDAVQRRMAAREASDANMRAAYAQSQSQAKAKYNMLTSYSITT